MSQSSPYPPLHGLSSGVRERLGDKARVEQEKPESRRVFGLELEEIVGTTITGQIFC